MNDKNKNELKEILGRFYGPEQAERMEAEIREGEELLRSYAAPEPDDMLIYNIKAGIAEALSQKRAHGRYAAMGKAIAVAAAFIIVGAVSIRLFQPSAQQPATPVAVVQADLEFEMADAQFAMLADEVDEIGGKLLAIRFGEEWFGSYDDLAEIETELIESDWDFWKG